jgi:hypothetical protein
MKEEIAIKRSTEVSIKALATDSQFASTPGVSEP